VLGAAEYRFLTTWCIDAPVERVWDVINDWRRWPRWWPGVESVVEIEPGDGNGLGARTRHRWRSRLPYTVTFDLVVTRLERPYLLEARAEGKLAGVGRWRLFEGEGTAVLYEWNVRTTAAWMNLLSPLARSAFEWNHDVVMRRGGAGLARELGASLLTAG